MLSKKEYLIMMHLRKNARGRLTKISRQTGIPVSTIHEKIKRCYKDIIKKYTVLLDFSNLGYTTRAQVIIKARKDQRNALKAYLMKQENVNSLYKINNGYDFLVEVIFKRMDRLEEFIEKTEEKFEILEKNVYYIIQEIKKESFLSNPVLQKANLNKQ